MGRRDCPDKIPERKEGNAMKRWIQAAVLTVISAAVAGMALMSKGCKERSNGPGNVLEHADITICLIGDAPDDVEIVMEKFNEMTERDLNCSVKVEWIVWGDFATKYPILLTTGKNIDLIYAANWLDFYENAQRGAFAPLDELLETYAPESFAALSEAARAQATINGNLYAIPANYTNYNVLGAIVRGDLMEKYQIGPLESFEDYLDFCEIMVSEEGIDPTGMCSMNTDMINMFFMSRGYYPINGTTLSPYWVDLNDENYPVYFQSECPGAEEYLSKAEEWYERGYWTPNVLVSKDETLLDSGLAASRIHNYDAYLGEYGINTEWNLRYFNLAAPIVRQTALQDAMAIPASSENKERAMMLLEKLRNDEAYYMLLTYGIEGYHYETNGREINFLNHDYGNEPGTWGFRENEYKRWDSVLPENAMEMRRQYERDAIDLPLVNFDLDLSKIQYEYSQIKDVMSVYYNPLKLGYIEYEEGMRTLNEKLKEAGNDKVKEEIQRQIAEFLEN